jgi:hypothetical protein
MAVFSFKCNSAKNSDKTHVGPRVEPPL